MAALFSRCYMRPKAGGTEKVVGVFVLLLVLGVVALYISQTVTSERAAPAADGSAVTAKALPNLPQSDWGSPVRVSVFTPDRLHEKINGRAELYLRFHVVSLTFGSYRHSVNGEQTIDVYWYDMGEAENAFGIYETESPPGAASLEIGHGGYQAGGAVFFVKDSSYVQVLPSGVDAADADAALEIARLIAEVAGSEPRP